MPRVADAERTVYKDLRLNGGVPDEAAQILPAHLPGADHTGKARFFQQAGGFRAVSRQLGACVQLDRDPAAYFLCGADVGDDQGVRTAQIRHLCRPEKIVQLPVPDQGVGGDVDPGAESVGTTDSLGKLFGGEISGVEPCVESDPAQINGVGAALDRRFQRLKRAGGGKKLGELSGCACHTFPPVVWQYKHGAPTRSCDAPICGL